MNQLEFELPVVFIKEGAHVVAYAPALDISTSGKDESEAKERFGEVARMFFADLIENNTVDAVLPSLGWQKIKEQWNPPVISQASVNVQVPAFA